MTIPGFLLFAFLYNLSLAAIDGLFNRLIFRDIRKLSHFSSSKQKIYHLPEWGYIGLIFLILIGIVFPTLASYFFAGWKFVFLYQAVYWLSPWDYIFGKLVFSDWLGDTPSLKIPWIGWIHLSLLQYTIIRLVLGAVFIAAASTL